MRGSTRWSRRRTREGDRAVRERRDPECGRGREARGAARARRPAGRRDLRTSRRADPRGVPDGVRARRRRLARHRRRRRNAAARRAHRAPARPAARRRQHRASRVPHRGRIERGRVPAAARAADVAFAAHRGARGSARPGRGARRAAFRGERRRRAARRPGAHGAVRSRPRRRDDHAHAVRRHHRRDADRLDRILLERRRADHPPDRRRLGDRGRHAAYALRPPADRQVGCDDPDHVRRRAEPREPRDRRRQGRRLAGGRPRRRAAGRNAGAVRTRATRRVLRAARRQAAVGRPDQALTPRGATLLRLTLENVGLIERAEIGFAGGLTVVTGETGSGKTMLLGGLALALGERADSESVRAGAERARAILEIAPDAALRERLAEAGFVLADDDDVIVQREVLAAGRSQARINGVPAGASQLRELIGGVADVVSQHEAQRLFAPAYALELLDRHGGDETFALRERVRAAYAELHAARARLAALRDEDGRALARAEFARYALGEIDAARVEGDDEDARLRERRDLLSNAERIASALGIAAAALEDDAGAVDALGAAETALLGVARYGERFGDLAGAASALQSEA